MPSQHSASQSLPYSSFLGHSSSIPRVLPSNLIDCLTLFVVLLCALHCALTPLFNTQLLPVVAKSGSSATGPAVAPGHLVVSKSRCPQVLLSLTLLEAPAQATATRSLLQSLWCRSLLFS